DVTCLEPNTNYGTPVSLRASAPPEFGSGGWAATLGLQQRPHAVSLLATADSRRSSAYGAWSGRSVVAERSDCRAGADLPRSFGAESRGQRRPRRPAGGRAGWTRTRSQDRSCHRRHRVPLRSASYSVP